MPDPENENTVRASFEQQKKAVITLASDLAVVKMETPEQAVYLLSKAWLTIADECMNCLGGELHYQAMVYHSLRVAGVPLKQLGMNVRQDIRYAQTELFRRFDERKHVDFRGGFETIPDVVLFKPEVNGDWRRRRAQDTLLNMLVAIEIKASERDKSRLREGEIKRDIEKLAAHREEVEHLGAAMVPVMMVLDTAPVTNERMTPQALKACREFAASQRVAFAYLSLRESFFDMPPSVAQIEQCVEVVS
ncbi:hypothetical protein [Salipiger sp. PrR003]|uniref:hypothetical protein n=1 Tax=Salipiger sp. PrR003 TaxID=2706776 RepID=UPI0013DBE14E|nr:hypothetical protein [Salipiger sp. PrR003]NDV52960.1 hypothetical protein [Salipiger sp. PrR003]